MDYKIKDIYITLLPGLNLAVFVISALALQGVMDISKVLPYCCESIDNIGTLMVLMIPLLCIMLGYSIHILGSSVFKPLFNYRTLSKTINTIYAIDNLSPLYESAKNIIDERRYQQLQLTDDGKLTDVQIKETVHIIKDLLEPSVKIEEYFVRYAQAQNMLTSEMLALLIQIAFACSCYHCVEPNVCGNVVLLAVHAILICLYSSSLKRNVKRYEEVIWAEFVKYVEKK